MFCFLLSMSVIVFCKILNKIPKKNVVFIDTFLAQSIITYIYRTTHVPVEYMASNAELPIASCKKTSAKRIPIRYTRHQR